VQIKSFIALAILSLTCSAGCIAQPYDIVILNGRVMDPETNFDGVRNVGIKDGIIVSITESNIEGINTINASGLVVSPGFIDYHWHGLEPLASKIALRDGVTTALDLEAGALNVDLWYAEREGRQLYNYGTTASHAAARMLVHDADDLEVQTIVDLSKPISFFEIQALIGVAGVKGVPGWSATKSNLEQVNAITEKLDEELRQGALGIGSLVGYMRSGVTTLEMLLVQEAAAHYGRTTAVHARFYPSALTPIEHPTGFNEVFTNAWMLDAPLLYLHNVDYGWWEIEEKLAVARDRGLNMYGEQYPYDAGSTVISAEFLLPSVYEAGGNEYGESDETGGIYDPASDVFYTREEFLKKRQEEPGRIVFAYFSIRKPWIEHWVATDGMLIGSDGIPHAGEPASFDEPFETYAGHPRSAGTRGKSFRIARANGVPLMRVIANAAYYPAKHLGDAGLEAMQKRGRMQEGMVADIVVFDPETITDNATYKNGEQGLPTTGIPYILVNGQIVVKDSTVLEVHAGQPIRYPEEEQGRFEPISESNWLKQFPDTMR